MFEAISISPWNNRRLQVFRDQVPSPQAPSSSSKRPSLVEGEPPRKRWKLWTAMKLRKRPCVTTNRREDGGTDITVTTIEMVNLFPGWAVRRYPPYPTLDHNETTSDNPDVSKLEVFISGYATSHLSAQFPITHYQRAFLSLAKEFAGLPRVYTSNTSILSSPIILDISPKPAEISEDEEVEALERHLHLAKASSSTRNNPTTALHPLPPILPLSLNQPPPTPLLAPEDDLPTYIRHLHTNLETRIAPFWSSPLPHRKVRVEASFGSPPPPRSSSTAKDHDADTDADASSAPLASMEVTTAPDGSFQARFLINQHRAKDENSDLYIIAQILPLPPAPAPHPPNAGSPTTTTTTTTTTTLHISPSPSLSPTPTPIRLISDIDDTIKLTSILSGPRTAFYNVFVREHRECVIPGMGEWYNAMWKRGVGFHYVSNSPFELLPTLTDFFQIAKLPSGSLKLKSYAGHLFQSLLSAPGARKRASVIEVLDSFPDSRFFLVGDTGEQDLELYSDIASERPAQIVGIFIRDVGVGEVEPLDEPTGVSVLVPVLDEGSGSHLSPMERKASSEENINVGIDGEDGEPFVEPERFISSPRRAATRPISSSPPSASTPDADPLVSKPDIILTFQESVPQNVKRRHDLQMRVYKARSEVPTHIPLRIFRDPEECVEVGEILDRNAKYI